MLWFPLTLLCAISLATSDMFSKKALLTSDEYHISLIRFSSCLPPLYLMLYLNGIPEIKEGFFLALLLSTPLEITAMVLYNRAIRISPLSLTLPFLSFTPIFLIFTAYIFIGEVPNSYGIIGIVLITVGGYMLNIDTKNGILYPIKAVIREKGSILMLFVAFIYSITSVFGKIMIDKSDFIFTPAAYFTFVTLITTVIVRFKGVKEEKPAHDNKRLYILIAFFSALMIISHFTALNLIKVEYMVSVKRSSMLFGILYGSIIFGEIDIKKRLFGSVVMLIGIAMIGFLGS